MPVRRFIVTGCGRSGTKWAAQALTAAGLPCGHEIVFHPRVRRPMWSRWVPGEASWLAVPYLGRLGGVTVVHQVRHPLDVIRSLCDIKLFDPGAGRLWYRVPDVRLRRASARLLHRVCQPRSQELPSGVLHSDYARFVHHWCAPVASEVGPLAKSTRYWMIWNALVEPFASLRVRLEDLQPGSLALHEVIDHLGGGAASAADGVSRTINRRAVSESLTWDDLPLHLVDDVRAQADRYGYASRSNPQHQKGLTR